MNRPPRAPVLTTVAMIGCAAVVCALTLSRSFHDQITRDIFFSLTLAGCTIVFLSVRPLRELPQVVGAALVLAGLQLAVLKVPFKTLPALALVGLSSLFFLAVRRIGSRCCRGWDISVPVRWRLRSGFIPKRSIYSYTASIKVWVCN